MKWEKRGLIYCPDGSSSWAKHTALQPTPILLDADTIRVYLGFRDEQGAGRVGYVDVSAHDPRIVKGVSESPCLDVGAAHNTFDCDGVIPCAIVKRGNELYLYYAGYNTGGKVRFTVFGGLAISQDGGETFQRYSKVPVADRTDDELLFRVIHSILPEQGKWKAWYGGGSEFQTGAHKSLPVYNIRSMVSEDGIVFPSKGTVVVDNEGEEHRVGRPYVIKLNDEYLMFFGSGSEKIPYQLTYASSMDGQTWTRRDDLVGLERSESGWDSEMTAYPAVIQAGNKTYMFYNGNDYGKTGFGFAELMER